MSRSSPDGSSRYGVIGWMSLNAVAANILMLFLVIGGLAALQNVRQEVFPSFQIDTISVSVAYPGASPEEIEEGILLAIESEVRAIEGIEEVTSSASEGIARVALDIDRQADPNELLQYVKNAIDQVQSFPVDIEEPQVQIMSRSRFLVSIGLSADLSELELADMAEAYRNKLLLIEGVSAVEMRGMRRREISIEIRQEDLRALDMTLEEAARLIGRASRDIPGGSMQTAEGEFLLRTEGRKVRASDFEDLPIRSLPGGDKLRLKDVAVVKEGFEDTTQIYEFDGSPGIRIDVYQAQNAGPIETAKRVGDFIENEQSRLPESVAFKATSDRSEIFAGRMEILIKNGGAGLLLVLLMLGLFLKPRLAFWVSISIPVVLIGALGMLPYVDVTLNVLSMFAFIMTLGIVVDDSIIVGENIYAKRQAGASVEEAVLQGAKEMTAPVIFSVATNIIAFLPLLMVPGVVGQFLKALPLVACVVFLVSLIEALFVLPAHVRHALEGDERAQARRQSGRLSVQDKLAQWLDGFRHGVYSTSLQSALRARYLTLIVFVGLCMSIMVWWQSGRIDYRWSPEVPGDRVDAELMLPADASFSETLGVARQIEAAGLRAIERLGGREYLNNWFIRVGQPGPNYADVNMELVDEKSRHFTQTDFTRIWREELGPLPEARSLIFEFLVGPGSSGIRAELSHPSTEVLEEASMALAKRLGDYQGMVDITDGVSEGKRQLRFTLTPEGNAVGLDETALGRQLRSAYFGAEATRLLRDSVDVRVMVRLPKEERQSLSDLQDFVILAPNGVEIPLAQAAIVTEGRAFSTIDRKDGQRVVTVRGEVDSSTGLNRSIILSELRDNIVPELMGQYPELSVNLNQARYGRVDPLVSILSGLGVSLLVIYALLAGLFRSYSQGIIVMLTIPFSVAAAIFGHIILGHNLSSISIYGMIALSGLVVNGALVLTLRFNQALADGKERLEAVIDAAVSRFRPILLTSLTTSIGLAPMLFETSAQARFLIPMAIALSFGSLFSTFVVLYLLPCLHMIAGDIQNLLRNTLFSPTNNLPSEGRAEHG